MQQSNLTLDQHIATKLSTRRKRKSIWFRIRAMSNNEIILTQINIIAYSIVVGFVGCAILVHYRYGL